MSIISGWGSRVRGLFADTKGPWGPSGTDGGEEPPPGDGVPGPWGDEPRRRRRSSLGSAGSSSGLEDFLRRSRARFGGGEGGGPDRSIIGWAALALVVVWLVFTSFHSISPGQRGVVSRFGRYSYTLGPGVGFTLPSPIDRVQKLDVSKVRNIDLGSDSGNDLMLTGDQNLLDIA